MCWTVDFKEIIRTLGYCYILPKKILGYIPQVPGATSYLKET